MTFTVQYTPAGGQSTTSTVAGGSSLALPVTAGQTLSEAYGTVYIFNEYGALVVADDVTITEDVTVQYGADAFSSNEGVCAKIYTFYGPTRTVTSFSPSNGYRGDPMSVGEFGNWGYNIISANTSLNTYHMKIGYDPDTEAHPSEQIGTVAGAPVLKYTISESEYCYRIPKESTTFVDGNEVIFTLYVYIPSTTELDMSTISDLYLSITQLQPASATVWTLSNGEPTAHEWVAGATFTLPQPQTGYAWYWTTLGGSEIFDKQGSTNVAIYASPYFAEDLEYLIIVNNLATTNTCYLWYQKNGGNQECITLGTNGTAKLATTAQISDTYNFMNICWSSQSAYSDLIQAVSTYQTLSEDLVVNVNADVIKITVYNNGPVASGANIYEVITYPDTTEDMITIAPYSSNTIQAPYGGLISDTYSHIEVYADDQKSVMCYNGNVDTSQTAFANISVSCLPVAVFSLYNNTSGQITVVYTNVGTQQTDSVTLDQHYEFAVGCTYNQYLNTAYDDIKVYAGTDTTKPPLLIIDGSDYYMNQNYSVNVEYQNVAAIYVSTSGGTGILKYEQGGVQGQLTLVDPNIDPDGNVFITDEVPNAGDALSTVYTSIAMYDDTGNNLVLDLTNQTVTGIALFGVAVPVQNP